MQPVRVGVNRSSASRLSSHFSKSRKKNLPSVSRTRHRQFEVGNDWRGVSEGKNGYQLTICGGIATKHESSSSWRPNAVGLLLARPGISTRFPCPARRVAR